MAEDTKNIRFLRNLRTRGTQPPVDLSATTNLEGVIAIAMDDDNPRIFFLKNNKEFAEFLDSQYVKEREWVIANGFNYLAARLDRAELDYSEILKKLEEYYSYRTSYDNQITNVHEALDKIMERLYYKTPDPLNVTTSVKLYKNGLLFEDTPHYGMNLSGIKFGWFVNNYADSISSIVFDGSSLPTDATEYEYTPDTPIVDDVSKNLTISTDYKDIMDVTPDPFKYTYKVAFKHDNYYFLQKEDVTDVSSVDISDKNRIELSGSQPYTINLGNNERHIVMCLDHEVKEDNIHVYDFGGTDFGGGSMRYVGSKEYTQYDNPITYYIYVSNQALNGKWSVRIL